MGVGAYSALCWGGAPHGSRHRCMLHVNVEWALVTAASPDDALEGLIDALADLVRRHRNLTVRVSRESGLPASQVAVLASLCRLGESRIAEVAEDLLVDPSVISRHISPL